MYVVAGIRFKKGHCLDDFTYNFWKKYPKNIFYLEEKEFLETLESCENEEDEREFLDTNVWELDKDINVKSNSDNLNLEHFFSYDEESSVFGVKVYEIDGAGEKLSKVLSKKSYYDNVKSHVKALFKSFDLPQEYVDAVDIYCIMDW